MIYPQLLLDIHEELIVDLFAGGGGASCGIEMALGRQVDIAVNHDEAAVAMHEVNHPQTRHKRSDVFEVDPRDVTEGRPVGLLWASPDCTFHSKARGQKPIRSKEKRRRALAWVVKRWAGQVRPRVIMLENVEEFQDWGPLIGPPDKLRPDPKRKGKTFRKWVRDLEAFGYQVEWRELRACDFGAPTIRKRLFVIARCDGEPIVWPTPTHGSPTSKAVKKRGRKPYRTAAECIDWSLPIPSIFLTPEEAKEWGRANGQPAPRRPLAEATMRRIARGVMRYVVNNAHPFIVRQSGDLELIAPSLVQTGYGERGGQKPRALNLEAPIGTIVGSQKHALVSAFLAQNNAGFYYGVGRSLEDPVGTILSRGSHQSLVAANLVKMRGTSSDADPSDPLHTVSAQGTHHGIVAAHLMHNYTSNTRGGQGDPSKPLKTLTTGNHAALVYAFLHKYYGTGEGSLVGDPMHTITTKERFGLVTVIVDGLEYVIVDICMRMLQPRELYRAQGFPDSYVITMGIDGTRFTKTQQVQMVGNSVPPHLSAALARANVPELQARRIAA